MCQSRINSGSNNDLNDWVFKMPIIRHNYLKNKEFPLELSSFIDDLGILINEIRESDKELFDENTKIIYLIDEAQQIFDNHHIIEEIRYIIQEPNLKIGFVFAGDNSYQTSKWENVFGGTQRDFEILDLNYFSEPRAVHEYFSKSLNSVGWTEKEIEETLFYRFQRACMQIYTLTSGKPSWINVIASKMFERCMKGETTLMKFDRQAQEDVKELLSKGGFLDSFLIDFINNLSSKHSKWLRLIFASELSTLDEVFFYAKYIITGADALDKNEFLEFCQKLVEKNIIILFEKSIDSKIGYNKVRKDFQNDMLQKRYIAFGYDSDKLKQWLQINTNGHYHFSVQPPEFSFINQINSELVCDGHNSTEVLLNLNKKPENIDNLNIIITSLNEKKIDIDQFNNHQIFFYYKLFKRLRKSRDRQILYVELGNAISSNHKTWMVYNYDEHQNIVGFNKLESRISKYIENINSFNSENEQYNLKITIQYLDKPNLEYFQKLIIDSKDSKKIRFVIEDKHDELIRSYIKNNDIESSFVIAKFFKELFISGYDLELSNLNNIAYVFMKFDDLDTADELLSEARRKINNGSYDKNDKETIPFIFYNYSIIQFKKGKLRLALEGFIDTKSYIVDNDITDTKAGALNQLKTNDQGLCEVVELKEEDVDEIDILNCSINNIELLTKEIKTFEE